MAWKDPGPWTTADVLARLPATAAEPLPPPMYFGLPQDDRRRVMLGVEGMARHTSDEGAQLQWGLGHAGYLLAGHGFDCPETDVPAILDFADPGVVLVQDPREWEGRTADRRGPGPATFRRMEYLAARADVFVGTIVKDAHQQPDYHRDWCRRMGAHFFVTYYHPEIVCRLAPHVRREHVVRIHHTVDALAVPPYSGGAGRVGCLLSGAVSDAYPLRRRLFDSARRLPMTDVLRHPGYHAGGAATPEYLRTLSRYKVAICTASRYGYCLRRIVEATACGCAVITDLPADDVLPAIDGNLRRVHNDVTASEVADVIREQLAAYNPDRQQCHAAVCLEYYDYRAAGLRLAQDVESLRRRYP